MFGMRNARVKASRTVPVPNTDAIMASRASPVIRLTSVSRLTDFSPFNGLTELAASDCERSVFNIHPQEWISNSLSQRTAVTQ